MSGVSAIVYAAAVFIGLLSFWLGYRAGRLVERVAGRAHQLRNNTQPIGEET